jgi:hypothetical protein
MGLPSGISAFPERVQYQFDGIESTKRGGPTSAGNLKNLGFKQGDFSREWQYFRVFATSASGDQMVEGSAVIDRRYRRNLLARGRGKRENLSHGPAQKARSDR